MFMNSGHSSWPEQEPGYPWAVPYLCPVIPAVIGVWPGTHSLQGNVEPEVVRGTAEQGGRPHPGNRVKKCWFLVRDERRTEYKHYHVLTLDLCFPSTASMGS